MSENNGWPDPARPGVPPNPEKKGWHWVQRIADGFDRPEQAVLWTDDWNGFTGFAWDAIGYTAEENFGRHFYYLGPALTPTEVEARVVEARRAALEEAAVSVGLVYPTRPAIAAHIRALKEDP